jgi:hypothetical protein
MRKTIHALSGIWTHGLSVQALKIYTSDRMDNGTSWGNGKLQLNQFVVIRKIKDFQEKMFNVLFWNTLLSNLKFDII